MKLVVFLAGVAAMCGVAPAAVTAKTLTEIGIRTFEPSLGTLTRVTVTIDPRVRVTAGAPNRVPWTGPEITDHQHEVTFPSFELLGRQVVFPPVTTGASGGVTFHSHTYDAPAVDLVFEDDELVKFLPGALPTPSAFLFSATTTTALEHSHSTDLIGITFNGQRAEATTTFEYIAVPEPASWLLLLAGGLAASGWRCRPTRRAAVLED